MTDDFVLHAEEVRRTLRSSSVMIRIERRLLDEESASVHGEHHIESEERAARLYRCSSSLAPSTEQKKRRLTCRHLSPSSRSIEIAARSAHRALFESHPHSRIYSSRMSHRRSPVPNDLSIDLGHSVGLTDREHLHRNAYRR